MRRTRLSSQRGGAIFMVFIAVALFAALSYAFLRGSQSNVTMMTDEQASVAADRIMGFGNDVRTGVKRLMLRGCKDDQINFANTQYKYRNAPTLNAWSQGHVTNSPADFSCNIFNAAGAGLAAVRFPELAIKDGTGGLLSGDSYPTVTQVLGIGTTSPELVWKILEINTPICAKINAKLGIGTGLSDGIPNDFEGYKPFNAANNNYSSFDVVGDEAPELLGKTAFCIHENDTKNYGSYYVVLIPR